jgi:methionyl-tRNA formyltransferase
MLRLVFVTVDDPFYVCEFFREFGPAYDRQEVEVAGVVIQAPLGRKSRTTLARQMLDFYGWWDFLRVGFRYAGRAALGVLAVRVFRGHFWGSFSVEHIICRQGWKILPCGNVNDPEFIHVLGELKIDLVVSVAASQKFKEDLLSAPRYGCINIHNARLPKNRGMLPNFWALYHYDSEPTSGMTVHKMNATLDDGPILLQEELELDPRESLDHLIRRTKRLNARLLLAALALYRNGEPEYRPNRSSEATYNSFPNRQDVKAFRAKGLKLI